jgi:hypothetical protein
MHVPLLTPVNFNYLFLALILCVPAAVLLLPWYWRSREYSRLLDLAEKAMEAGQPVPAEILERIAARPVLPSAESDLRQGILSIALALGLALCAAGLIALQGTIQQRHAAALGALTAAAIPLCRGIALLLLGRWSRTSGML